MQDKSNKNYSYRMFNHKAQNVRWCSDELNFLIGGKFKFPLLVSIFSFAENLSEMHFPAFIRSEGTFLFFILKEKRLVTVG